VKARRRNTPAQAKNLIRRAVQEIIDPGPRSVDALWKHFEARCAYCRRPLDRQGRGGQIDHAEPGGGNQLGNLVLACGTCNGDEKRELAWVGFLRSKCPDSQTYAEREGRILSWFALHPRPPARTSAEVARLREELVHSFGVKCAELKRAVSNESLSADTSSESHSK
jgi:hypothetical protein